MGQSMFGVFRIFFAIAARFGPWVLLAAALFLIGILLTLLGLIFGFDLTDVDLWLEAHGGWFAAIGNLIFRIVCGFVFLICAFVAIAPFFFRKDVDADKPGWGCALLAVPVAYFAWVGAFGSY